MIIPRDAKGYSIIPCAEPVTVLASLLTSEAPSYVKYPLYSEMIGGAVVNAAEDIRRKNETFTSSLLRRIVGTGVLPGKLGPQSGRWASTRQDPILGHLELAERIIAAPDIYAQKARGATQWIDQRTQVFMHLRKPETNPAPEALMSRRYKSGAKWVGAMPGIDPWILTLLGPHGVSLGEAMDMMADGRSRWMMPID